MNEILCDRYQILHPLDSGGFGETFLAVDLHSPTQRKVVVKALKSVNHNTSSEIIEKLFFKEAQVLEELGQNCPQIPTLYAYFCQDDKYYLVQEYIEGKNLSQSGILSSDRCLTILTSLLDTLKYVHSKNIIHRDIKPENIIIRASDGLPVLIDFGAVKETMGSFNTSSGSTVSSVVIGTRGFIAPEQSMGRTVFSTDLFALGLTMIYSLTGKYPIELPSNNLTGELEWQNLVANLHPTLAKVLEKAIKMEISNRYLTAETMQEDLYLSQFQTVAFVPPKGDNVKTSNINIEKNTDPIPVVQPPVSQPIYPEPEINTSSNSYPKQNDKSSSNILIILLILILALLGSLAGFFIIQNINQTQQKIAEIEQEKERIKSQLSEENLNKEREELEALKQEVEQQRLEAERLYQKAKEEDRNKEKISSTTGSFDSGSQNISAIVFDPPSNIRTTPNGEIICSVNAVTSITINTYGSANGWYVTDFCGRNGYIHHSQIHFENTVHVEKNPSCLVTNIKTGQLAVRKSPGGESLAGLNNDDVVQYIRGDFPWYYIRVIEGSNRSLNGRTGWVNANYLECA
ncbi:protein kinase domain-containing protein [Cyanobacterium aponinum]|uniref:protein kinase domain-containing protein n=1 Tax=Cyanobacterium aponinum TaxID=379064 RepID=UPI000C12A01E|nr:protein kinase [Cyanobacterium aponinum]PHV62794.1 serine/threonine protein kinase [Cyanobacterium aponinum IPPAS B-1201]